MSELLSRPASFSKASRLAWIDRAIGVAPWALGALFGAVAIHLLTILALPTLWPGAPYRVLASRLALGQKATLPRPAVGGQGTAFSDPFAALAVCRFDLSRGPLRLRAQADGDRPFSVSVRLTDGTIIYSGNDRQTPGGTFNILIVSQAQADALDPSQDTNQDADQGSGQASGQGSGQGSGQDAAPTPGPGDELRLVSPSPRGFAVFRVLSLREGDYDAAAAALASAQCSMEKPTR
ncbi:hypothetical protein K9U39_04010 [Rhodoblastus acidophilus]|uniref:DUF1254 domain-containing protein n=1 Tax=Candidatus Rhodoblastus alkanivorans TaxID=2954117 RepID=A0ABS9Z555_9HYPH|nr:hypothetical protein [Candidatus Rhodoblastus alkanivorans]MCI4680539.1 hypothetical protein [Candidatus Rhodoblastus alkanivorans]MCI4682810.1 hypothetical protein [Candidatus Rhodoblastus alkanivorans]MDI4640119.1 hypothetical protein [Rhodoblastus acidophilus]